MKFHYRCCAAYLQKTDILVLGVGQMLCCKEQIRRRLMFCCSEEQIVSKQISRILERAIKRRDSFFSLQELCLTHGSTLIVNMGYSVVSFFIQIRLGVIDQE